MTKCFSSLALHWKKWMVAAMMVGAIMPISSCSSDDPDSPSDQLVGTWYSVEEEEDDGILLSVSETLVFKSDHTGSTTISASASSRAAVAQTYTEYFSWTSDKDGDNIGYVSFIHTGGDEVYGTGRYYYTVAGKTLSLAGETFTKQ